MGLVLLAGCSRELSDVGAESGKGAALAVRVDVPSASTREAIVEGTIESLWLMVFNHNGTYISRHEGVLSGGAGNYSEYTFRGVQLSDDEARTLHFVANYDWSNFDDIVQAGNAESTILPRMTVDGDRMAYWKRMVLPEGIAGNPGETIALPGGEKVSLLRNMARITLTNNTTDGGNGMSLENVQFVVGNRFDKGSVALYNPTAGVFGTGANDNFVMEAPDGAVMSAPTDVDFGTQSVNIYERANSTARNAAYLIVRGNLRDGNTISPQPSYYKIDIVGNEETRLLDLRRNHSYDISINLVSNDGYSNLTWRLPQQSQ